MVSSSELIMFLNSISSLVRRREWDSVARKYNYPLPFYHQNDLILILTPEENCEAQKLRHEYLVQANIERLKPEIVQIEDKSENRCLVIVDWKHLNADGISKRTSRVRYVCSYDVTPGSLRIELVEYLVPAFPGFSEQFSRKLSPRPRNPFEFLP